MSTTIKVSKELVVSAKPCAAAMQRSVAKQIEYWAKLGKAAEDNPDLPVNMILDVLVSLEEAKAGMLKEYQFECKFNLHRALSSTSENYTPTKFNRSTKRIEPLPAIHH